MEKEETKIVVNEENASTKSIWLNRIYSAVLGIIVGVGSMFGITKDQIDNEKKNLETIKVEATAALEALKTGKTDAVKESLSKIITAGTAIKETTIKITETAKDAGKKADTVINAVKDSAAKAAVKSTDASVKEYSAQTK